MVTSRIMYRLRLYMKDRSNLLCLSSEGEDHTQEHCPYCDKLSPREVVDEHKSERHKMRFDSCAACLPEESSTMRSENHKNELNDLLLYIRIVKRL